MPSSRHALIAAGLGLVLLVAACAPWWPFGAKEDKLVLEPAAFAALDGFAQSDPRAALQAFATSCAPIVKRKDGEPMGGDAAYGTAKDWKAACIAASMMKDVRPDHARVFFETWFVPVAVLNRKKAEGLFTGYYEPQLNGSLKKEGRYQTPLLARPTDLITVDLGAFRPALKGERIAGRIDGGKLVPYPVRGDIVANALKNVSKPIVYVDSAVDAFFLQVQGSGRVKLPDGRIMRVGYDGQNGHPYTAIGRVLIDRGEVPREKMSMQAIRDWLTAHPKQAGALMNENPSYVFFKELAPADPNHGAPGAAGVPLTPEASLAVDMRFHALGAPMWIEAEAEDKTIPDGKLRKLVVAQDTGGAIRGPVRGDVYWGAGPKAEAAAGRMADKGKLFVFLPKPVAARLQK